MFSLAQVASIAIVAPMAVAGAPQYTITDLGIANPGDFASQGFGISPDGVAFGRSAGTGSLAFTWTQSTGLVPLPNVPSRSFGVANGANDNGQVVGVGSTTLTGAGALPLMWDNGTVSQLPLGAGFGVGRANDVNDAGLTVGSLGGGIDQTASYWSSGAVNVIDTITAGGSSMTTAFRVNNAGMIVGVGVDPNQQARNVPLMYDVTSDTLTEIPALTGDNGGIAFDVSENGLIVGSSSFNQAGSVPFIWSASTGSVEIPLPANTSTASARGVNSNGWVVGTGSGQFAVPFLYDGDQTYTLQDLIPTGSGWDLSMNTFSSALGISEDGNIVGTGVFNGEIRAYQLTLIPSPATSGLLGVGALTASRRRRR
jgi:uncharacterized membrane protein